MLQHSSAPLAAMLRALQPGSDGDASEAIAARSHAAECLLLAASDVSTRQRWIEGGGWMGWLNGWMEKETNGWDFGSFGKSVNVRNGRFA